MGHVILITGASSGFGRLAADALAMAGHTVYASMRGTTGHNAAQVAAIDDFARSNGVDLRTVELDVGSAESVDAAVEKIIGAAGRIDIVVHNAGHMCYGPAEAFTPKQLADLYEVNVIGAQRVNMAVLPHMRAKRRGLVLWMSSSSVAGEPRPTSARTSRPRPPWMP